MGIFNKDNNKQSDNKLIDIPIKAVDTVKTIRRLFLVDYENVSDAGIVGVDTLTNNDTVIIFYGSKVKSVAYDSLIAITNSKANIEHLKAEKTAKNYLDFQLTTYLGYKLGKETFDEIFVISKDSGFDAVVDFWSQKKYTIKRQDAIVMTEKTEIISEEKPKRPYTKRTSSTHSRTTRSSRPKVVTKSQPKKPRTPRTPRPTVTDRQKSEIRAALKNKELNAPDYKKIYDAFASSDTISTYNNKLQRAFDNEKTSEIYKVTAKIFEKEHS